MNGSSRTEEGHPTGRDPGSLSDRARELVGGWPPGGLVAGVLADPSDPEWAGRASLVLALAATDRPKSVLVLDLAPEATDLATRFGAAEEPGFAELVNGDALLWEIVRRHAGGSVFYVPPGVRTSGADLARSPAAASLAQRLRRRGRTLLVPLDRRGAGEAASAGWVDGFVQVGEKGVSSARLSGDAASFGHLGRRPGGSSTVGASAEEGTGSATAGLSGPDRRPTGGGSGGEAPRRTSDTRPRQREPRHDGSGRRPMPRTSNTPLALRRRSRSRGGLRKAVSVLFVAGAVVAAGLTASTWLGGPGWEDVGAAAGSVAGEVEQAVSAGADRPGPASDSVSRSGAGPDRPTRRDSAGPAAPDTGSR